MATTLSKAEQQRTKRAWEKSGYNDTHAAEILGIGRPGFRHRRKMMGLERPIATSESVQQLDARVAQRTADDILALKRQIKQLNRELNDADDLRSVVFKLARQDTTPPKWTLPPKGKNSSGIQIPILMFSDFHLGEYIQAGELDGINAFDQRIAEQRYRRMIEKTILLATKHMPGAKVPGIVYCRMGDLIAGEIHDLKETNDLKALPAVRKLVSLERWGLEQLLKAFGHVWVISVPGNHGRSTDKPHSKENAERNYDVLAGYMLEVAYQDDARVQFWAPESGDAVFGVLGNTIVATHGDKMGVGGGRGFIGPAAPFIRGTKLLRAYYADLGIPVDYVLAGHLHTEMDVDGNFCNGCICGYSQYGKQFRFAPRRASQWLLFFDAEHGITARWSIQLSDKPRVGAVQDFEKLN